MRICFSPCSLSWKEIRFCVTDRQKTVFLCCDAVMLHETRNTHTCMRFNCVDGSVIHGNCVSFFLFVSGLLIYNEIKLFFRRLLNVIIRIFVL